MSKSPDFYKRYITAVFHRGKSEKLPLEYIMKQARMVLKSDELQILQQEIDTMIESGAIVCEGDMLQLQQQ